MNADPRAEQLAQLEVELADRTSVVHFAYAATSLVASVLVASAAAKLFWDSIRTPGWAWGLAALSVGVSAFGVQRYLKGRRAHALEEVRFAQLKALRLDLHVDDPAALLPQ